MENLDFEIELLDEETLEEEPLALPVNYLLFGETENDDLKVYIKQDTYKALEKLASSDTSKELGSILIGQKSEEMGKRYVVITDYIEAKFTDASASTLTFTHETWDYIHKERAEKYSDKIIVGWQHTHPSYGIFLSNYDMFIQENFFDLPFQVAYVIDPIQNLRGFFQWKNDKVQKLSGYHIYDDPGIPIKIQQKPVKTAENPRKGGALKIAVAVLSVLVVAMGVLALSFNGKYHQQKSCVAKNEEVIAQQEQEINDLNAKLATELTGDDKALLALDLIDMIKSGEIKVKDSEIVLANLESIVNDNGENVKFVYYTVKKGDNLCGICAENGISYQKAKRLITALNGIKNPDSIYVGQLLLLPSAE